MSKFNKWPIQFKTPKMKKQIKEMVIYNLMHQSYLEMSKLNYGVVEKTLDKTDVSNT